MTLKKSYSVQEIAEITFSKIEGDPKKMILNVADLESAKENDISFLGNPRYEGAMKKSAAGAIFIQPSAFVRDGRTYLLSEDPSLSFQKAIELFCPSAHKRTGFDGIHPTAIIHPTAKIGAGATIGPYVVIDEGVLIGARSHIGAHSYIGPLSQVGEDCYFHPRITLRERTEIGNRVILQPGCVIGSCGFGYIPNKEGKHTKLNQVGTVVIEDDVEIGANSTIDRSRFKETRIGQGTKIDNLVQIGHGVKIGPDNIIIAQCGIAGSTTTGKHVILAGHTAVAGHLHLADGVTIAGKSGVSKSLEKAGKYNGIPAIPLEEYNRNMVYLRSISKLVERVKELERMSHKD